MPKIHPTRETKLIAAVNKKHQYAIRFKIVIESSSEFKKAPSCSLPKGNNDDHQRIGNNCSMDSGGEDTYELHPMKYIL